MRIVSQVAIPHQRSDAQAAIVQALDTVESRQVRDVDHAIGADNATFHQVEKIGGACEIDGTGLACSRDGLRDGRRSDIIENLHAAFLRLRSSICFCAASTASVIPI